MTLNPAKIIYSGVGSAASESQVRAIILCNTIALIAQALGFIFLIYATTNGWSTPDTIIFAAVILFGCVPWLNSLGKIHLSRFLLPLIIPVTCVSLTIFFRAPRFHEIQYIRSVGVYCLILTTAIIPVLVFSTRERKLMVSSLALNFLLFASLDIIFRYYSELHALPALSQYLSANLAVFIAYVLLVGSVISLKTITDEYENRNNQLIEHLHTKNQALEQVNRELKTLNNDVGRQKEKIQTQHEELIQNREDLVQANYRIEQQKKKLEEQNEFLLKSLDEKSAEVLLTNQQLVAHNNELQQFSYTISHNLRGPVASMQGLINLHHRAGSAEERKQILTLLEQSALSLETVIRDLNKIIDIRNDKFSIFERVSLPDEVNIIRLALQPHLAASDAEIEVHFTVAEFVSVKAYINSILYNLISNAVQYRSLEERLKIKISSYVNGDVMGIEVTDNGLGIDLGKFKADIFKLYKRFHTHTQGKGLGLYLVKQQVEKLNGTIEIESAPRCGSTFRVLLPVGQKVIA